MIISLDDWMKTSQVSEGQINRYASVRHTGKRTRKEEEHYGKDSAFNFVFKLQGTIFDPSIHSAAQAKDRRPEFTKEDWKKLHRKVFWYIKDNRVRDGVFLFYNEEMKQGYIAAIRKGGKEVKIITVLPKGAYDPVMGSKGNTELALVEIAQVLNEEGVFFESVESISTIYV